MKLLEVLLLIHVANVSTQLISDQQTSPGFVQIQCRNKMHHSVPYTDTSAEIHRGVTEERTTTGFNNNNRRDESKGQKEAKVTGNRRTDQSLKVFVNVSRDEYGNDVTYIQRLKSISDPDKIIFYDDVNYDREPFTNERKPEVTYSTGPSRDPSATPYSKMPMSSGKQHQNSSKGTEITPYNVPYHKTTERTLHNNKDEETTTEIELDNRVAFSGDPCASGLEKVHGKCVPKV